jgi:hypothetical protein
MRTSYGRPRAASTQSCALRMCTCANSGKLVHGRAWTERPGERGAADLEGDLDVDVPGRRKRLPALLLDRGHSRARAGGYDDEVRVGLGEEGARGAMRRRPRSSTASARRSASRPAWPCSGRSPAWHSSAGAGARRRRSSRYRLRRRAERRPVGWRARRRESAGLVLLRESERGRQSEALERLGGEEAVISAIWAPSR